VYRQVDLVGGELIKLYINKFGGRIWEQVNGPRKIHFLRCGGFWL
jgi:hypothetical protein